MAVNTSQKPTNICESMESKKSTGILSSHRAMIIVLPFPFPLTTFALCLFPFAFRLSPYALRLMPYAFRLFPEIFLSALANFINFVAFKKANILQYEKN
jgi:hypothetical protein